MSTSPINTNLDSAHSPGATPETPKSILKNASFADASPQTTALEEASAIADTSDGEDPVIEELVEKLRRSGQKLRTAYAGSTPPSSRRGSLTMSRASSIKAPQSEYGDDDDDTKEGSDMVSPLTSPPALAESPTKEVETEPGFKLRSRPASVSFDLRKKIITPSDIEEIENDSENDSEEDQGNKGATAPCAPVSTTTTSDDSDGDQEKPLTTKVDVPTN